MSDRNLILIGMMGSGKTTCGQMLARALNRAFLDTDVEIEARQGRTISEIFAAEGEAYFRELELQLCQELSEPRSLIIACGGGLPLREACIGALRQGGTVVLLERDPGQTYDQLDTAGRPLAQQGREAFIERFRQRRPVYRACADLLVAGAPSPEAAVAEILNKLEKLEELQ